MLLLSSDGLDRLLGACNLGRLLGAPLSREGLVADLADYGEYGLVVRSLLARLRVNSTGTQATESRDGRGVDIRHSEDNEGAYVHVVMNSSP